MCLRVSTPIHYAFHSTEWLQTISINLVTNTDQRAKGHDTSNIPPFNINFYLKIEFFQFNILYLNFSLVSNIEIMYIYFTLSSNLKRHEENRQI